MSMGGRFLSSGMSLWRMQRPSLCLHCTRSFVSVAWRGVAWRGVTFQQRSVSLGSPPSLPPLSFLFIYLVIFSCGGLFILLPLGVWPQCDGCYSGGLGTGGSWLGCGLVGLWVFFRLGVYCSCSPLAYGHPTSTCNAGVNEQKSFHITAKNE